MPASVLQGSGELSHPPGRVTTVTSADPRAHAVPTSCFRLLLIRGGHRLTLFAGAPLTLEEVLDVCSRSGRPGDRIRAEFESEFESEVYKASAGDSWPISPKVARDFVDLATPNRIFGPDQSHVLKIRNRGRAGKFGYVKDVGPPPWRLPKVVYDAHRGPVTVTVGIGWRSTLHALIWMAPNPPDEG